MQKLMNQVISFFKSFRPHQSLQVAAVARSIQAFLSKGVIFIALVLYLNKAGTEVGAIALLTAVYFAPQLFLNVAIGSVSDLLESHELFILFSLVSSGVIYFFYPLAGGMGVFVVLVLRFIQGVFESPNRPLTQALASNTFEASRNSAVSFFKISSFFAASLGPLAVGYALENFNYEIVFPMAGMLMILTAIFLWLVILKPIRLKSNNERLYELARNSSIKTLRDHLLHTSIFSAFTQGNGAPSPFSVSGWKSDSSSLFSLITLIRRIAFQVFLVFIPLYLVKIVKLSEGGVGSVEGLEESQLF